MKYVVWFMVFALMVLHQDLWNWDNGTLVWGFMPITLLYQIGISVGASFVWFLATIFCWPDELIEEVQQEVEGGEQV